MDDYAEHLIRARKLLERIEDNVERSRFVVAHALGAGLSERRGVHHRLVPGDGRNMPANGNCRRFGERHGPSGYQPTRIALPNAPRAYNKAAMWRNGSAPGSYPGGSRFEFGHRNRPRLSRPA